MCRGLLGTARANCRKCRVHRAVRNATSADSLGRLHKLQRARARARPAASTCRNYTKKAALGGRVFSTCIHSGTWVLLDTHFVAIVALCQRVSAGSAIVTVVEPHQKQVSFFDKPTATPFSAQLLMHRKRTLIYTCRSLTRIPRNFRPTAADEQVCASEAHRFEVRTRIHRTAALMHC